MTTTTRRRDGTPHSGMDVSDAGGLANGTTTPITADDLPDWISEDEREPRNVTPIERARSRKADAPPLLPPCRTELDVAERLVERYGGTYLRHCSALGGWHVWTGTHWQRDERRAAREAVKVIGRELAQVATKTEDNEDWKIAKRACSSAGVTAILDLAHSADGVTFVQAEADRDPWLLNVTNGTLDLRTGELRPHYRGDLITRCCPVEYDPHAEAPTFADFLAKVQPDPEVRAYLARLFGYAMVGVVREHVLGTLWGPGANGKSVLADTVTHVLGDYAGPGPSSLIIANSRHEPHPTDVASLVGRRLVLVHETKKGVSFDASKVKLLTGGDRLTARLMRQDFFAFEPSHTLVMLSNYRPSADATDAALWRRVHLVPFEVVIPEDAQDSSLTEKIRAEAPGVLRWLAEGVQDWRRLGLAPPQVVREQTERYRASEDVTGQFLEECTVRLPQASVKASRLQEAYREWCAANGHRPVRGNDFAAEVMARGYGRKRSGGGNVYLGIGLHADTEEDR